MTISLRRGAIIAAIAAGIVIATPAMASAHVGVSPDAVPRDASTLLTFSFSHGCAESPTTSLRITIPDGSPVADPTFDAAWDTQIEKGADGYTSAITYTAIRPVPKGVRGAVSLSFRPAENAPENLVFPVEQTCETGTNEWTEVAKKGQDPEKLDSPAPAITLTKTSTTPAAAAADHGDHTDAATADASSTADAYPVVPTVLGAAGLVAGIAALVVAVAAYRRRA
ncbi:DUF1775 domain-containing protein [Microbacterium sp.]|uniref:DUF1775 domain-containing protein n=1 Tax=Microbacterium sp. TaxID=51671 RepID=UPI003A8D7751